MASTLHIVLRGLLTLAIVWQALSPVALATLGKAGFDVRTYFCSPTSTPTYAAEAQLTAVLKLAGKLDSETPNPDINPDHCSNCVISPIAVFGNVSISLLHFYYTAAKRSILSHSAHAWGVRGPPLGSRAPPRFV